jgi:coenzyme F420-reducing hydrogenase delta subunit
VVVAGCTDGDCRYTEGSHLAAEAVALARDVLRDLGRDPDGLLELWSEEAPAEPDPIPARADAHQEW